MAATDDLAWTTTRCNRLLRPLSTKLAKLRKELERPRSADGEPRKASNGFVLKASPRRSANFSQTVRQPRGADKASDRDWVPAVKCGGANKKTYGGRGGKKTAGIQRVASESSNVGRPGEIAITPLIARTGGRFQESPQFKASPLRKYAKNRGPLIKAEQIHQIKKQVPADIANLIKGLSEAYANLLQATTTGEEKRWKGTRSLFGACLRKVPEYIELEEHFAALDKEEEEDEDEDRDISQEIYTHLEAQFETLAGQGWRPFKQIVRAHATSLLCDAVADQILGLETLQLLVSHCLNISAWDEAERFLWSLLPRLKPLYMPNSLLANLFDEQRSPYMSMVKAFVEVTGRHRFLYDLLEYMISQELLPLEWLATESMRSVWDRLVRSLSDGDQRTTRNAFRFLETAICAGMGLPDESLFKDGEVDIISKQLKPSSRQEFRNALDTTYSSLLTVFCSIALVNRNRDEAAGEGTVQRITWVLDSILVGLMKRNDIREDLELLDPIAENMQTFAQRAVWASFAPFLVHLAGCRADASMLSLDVPTLAVAINWIASQFPSKGIEFSSILATLPEFISSAARGTGRIWKDDGFDQLQRLVQGLLSLSGLRLPHKLWTIKRLALESAMDFAHSTRNAEHMAYAREVEKTMRMKGHVVIQHSPLKNGSPSTAGGFKWEEGIGEWVACTPFAKQDVKRTPRKPVRALGLLLATEASRDECDVGATKAPDGGDLPTVPESYHWEINVLTDDDEDGDLPQSSPVKKAPYMPVSPPGKRTRTSSPTVVIPVKRNRLTPPVSPVIFYPELPREPDGPRRSRRSRKEISALVPALHSRRSKWALERGLRNLERKTYEEVKDINVNLAVTEIDEFDQNTSFSSSSSIGNQDAERRSTRSRFSLGKRSRRGAEEDEEDDRDELSKTPGLKKRKSIRNMVKRRREWWRVDSGTAEGAESDELSFQ
ncbi:hypothetical protein BU26DRAFT_519271 [Trematosphaeria pertusa]|uniref:Uncharacterized protein n=1 Tax=Trematosphaeria pertusa TaxID=390896 RepID=A0A6A6IGU9_9PLEO|nr:uncharacterized protein BU26DRAFT_519271 [Trematosphaeria pertusa]KAF2249112.1 hypothetical protein BU26DRAFT_519271 [Trematosphaeria pertusa]